MRKLVVLLGAVAIAAGLAACSALFVPGLASASAPRVVGTWADNASGGTEISGGYELWSNGRVVALEGAAYHGDAASSGRDDFVGMVTDYWAAGYWLVTSTGKVYSYGQVCKDERLARPARVPSSGIVGAVDLEDQNDEGFDLVAAGGATYQFVCQ